MTVRLRIGLVLALAASLVACAVPPSATPSAIVTSPRAKALPAERVKSAVVVGKSTKSDVIAALGETLVIAFDSGYEVWVYRLTNAPGAEFVILFAPSGVVAKTRLRPAPHAA